MIQILSHISTDIRQYLWTLALSNTLENYMETIQEAKALLIQRANERYNKRLNRDSYNSHWYSSRGDYDRQKYRLSLYNDRQNDRSRDKYKQDDRYQDRLDRRERRKSRSRERYSRRRDDRRERKDDDKKDRKIIANGRSDYRQDRDKDKSKGKDRAYVVDSALDIDESDTTSIALSSKSKTGYHISERTILAQVYVSRRTCFCYKEVFDS